MRPALPRRSKTWGKPMDIIKLVSQFATPAVLAKVASTLGLSSGRGAEGSRRRPSRECWRACSARRTARARPTRSARRCRSGRGSRRPPRQRSGRGGASRGSDFLSSLLGGDGAGKLADALGSYAGVPKAGARLAPRPRRLDGARRARQAGDGEGPRRPGRARLPVEPQGRDRRGAARGLLQGAGRHRPPRRPCPPPPLPRCRRGPRRRSRSRTPPPPPPPAKQQLDEVAALADRAGGAGLDPDAAPGADARAGGRGPPRPAPAPVATAAAPAPAPEPAPSREPPAPAATPAPADSAAAPAADPLVVGGVDIGAGVQRGARHADRAPSPGSPTRRRPRRRCRS